MERISFLKMGTLGVLAPLADSFFVQTLLSAEKKYLLADDIMKDLITANDAKVALLLTSLEPGNLKFSRRTGYDIAILSASYCSEGSKYYHDPLIVSRLDWLIRFLSESQSEDGTVNIANLESPPDTAFLMEILCATAHILSKDNSKEDKEKDSGKRKVIGFTVPIAKEVLKDDYKDEFTKAPPSQPAPSTSGKLSFASLLPAPKNLKRPADSQNSLRPAEPPKKLRTEEETFPTRKDENEDNDEDKEEIKQEENIIRLR